MVARVRRLQCEGRRVAAAGRATAAGRVAAATATAGAAHASVSTASSPAPISRAPSLPAHPGHAQVHIVAHIEVEDVACSTGQGPGGGPVSVIQHLAGAGWRSAGRERQGLREGRGGASGGGSAEQLCTAGRHTASRLTRVGVGHEDNGVSIHALQSIRMRRRNTGQRRLRHARCEKACRPSAHCHHVCSNTALPCSVGSAAAGSAA